jgi:glycosyltransferase involved in cell wall biosynthesis
MERLIESGVERKRAKVIPLPVRPLGDPSPAQIHSAWYSSSPKIATCGYMLPHKGVDVLIRAVGLLKEKNPDIALTICCPIYPNHAPSDHYLDSCRGLVVALGLVDNVKFVTKYMDYDELAVYLKPADIVAFPYTSDQGQSTSGALRMAADRQGPTLVSTLTVFDDLDLPNVFRCHATPEAVAASIQGHLDVPEQLVPNNMVERCGPQEIASTYWSEVYKALGDVPIHIEGVFKSTSSFAQVLNGLATAFNDIGCDTSVDSWYIGSDPQSTVSGVVAKLSSRAVNKGLTIRKCYPHDPTNMVGKYKSMIVPWECTHMPLNLGNLLDQHLDYVLVPSDLSAEAARNSGVTPGKIKKIKQGVDLRRFRPDQLRVRIPDLAKAYFYSRPDREIGEPFVFLHVGATMYRKGIDILLEAFCREFTGKENVLLLIKAFDDGSNIMDWLTPSLRGLNDPPKIVYVANNAPGAMMPGYYTAADCLIHPHRGEGFGLPILEGMATGKPAIVTRFGGPLEFCTEDNSYLIDAERVAVSNFHDAVPKEATWAEPVVTNVMDLMRYAYTNREATAQLGARARETAKMWTWNKSAYSILEALGLL